jgi:hypothetical protein
MGTIVNCLITNLFVNEIIIVGMHSEIYLVCFTFHFLITFNYIKLLFSHFIQIYYVFYDYFNQILKTNTIDKLIQVLLFYCCVNFKLKT